jgi:hypothetical protein
LQDTVIFATDERMTSWQPTTKHIIIGLIVAATIWIASWILPLVFLPDYVTRGQFGDMFGAANSLFSGLAMVGAIYAVLLQTKEIETQREEQRVNEEFRRHQMEAVNLNIAALREQISLLKMGGAPAIQWRSIIPGANEVKYTFVNKGGRIQITQVRILNSPKIGADWSRLFIGPDEKGSIVLKFTSSNTIPLPDGGLLFELHYATTYGPEFRKYRVEGAAGPVEEKQV